MNDANSPITASFFIIEEKPIYLWGPIMGWAFVLVFIVSLGFILFEIVNIIRRKKKQKPIKRQLWIFTIALAIFVLNFVFYLFLFYFSITWDLGY